MKHTGLQYRFDPVTVSEAWLFWHRCMWCGKNQWDCLHHIISPSSYDHKHGDFNGSILNSSPMHNHGCHLDNGLLHHRETEIALLEKTYHALSRVQGYKLKPIDIEFINIYCDSHYADLEDSCSLGDVLSAKKSSDASDSKNNTSADPAR